MQYIYIYVYICPVWKKVGHPISGMIRMDRQQRPDGSGGTSESLSETWEEAHAVLVEAEAVKAGTRMLRKPENAVATQERAGLRGQPGVGRDRSIQVCHNISIQANASTEIDAGMVTIHT